MSISATTSSTAERSSCPASRETGDTGGTRRSEPAPAERRADRTATIDPARREDGVRASSRERFVHDPASLQLRARAEDTASGHPTLRRGAPAGPDVTHAQERLAAHGFDPGRGPFGPNTDRQVRAFQAAHGLRVDGIIGPRTWRALEADPGAAPVEPAVTGPGSRSDAYINGRRTTIETASVGNGEVMRSDAAAAFNRMRRDAAAAGVTLTARSAFRTWDEQAELRRRWENGTGNPADRPGYSEHQSGISIDINNTHYGDARYRWLSAHASEYGFVNNASTEAWHWTYQR